MSHALVERIGLIAGGALYVTRCGVSIVVKFGSEHLLVLLSAELWDRAQQETRPRRYGV